MTNKLLAIWVRQVRQCWSYTAAEMGMRLWGKWIGETL